MVLVMGDRMEAASSSETSEYFHQTTRSNIPEDSHLDSSRSEQGLMVGFCKHGNEPSGSITCGEFLD
jgi:hypothetical protein